MLPQILRHVRLAFAALLLLMGLNAFFYSSAFSRANVLSETITYFFAPIQWLASRSTSSVASLFRSYIVLVNLQEENQRLRHLLAKQETALTKLREHEVQNRNLAKILQIRERIPTNMIHAMVIARSPDSLRNIVRINRGRSDGVKVNTPVINDHGAVGVTVKVYEHQTDVLLVADFNCYVDVLVQRSRVHGGIYGSDFSSLAMKYVENDRDVAVGDAIITSGLGNVWPKGIMVGTVSRTAPGENTLFQRIGVRPAVNFFSIEDVMVLLSEPSTAMPGAPR